MEHLSSREPPGPNAADTTTEGGCSATASYGSGAALLPRLRSAVQLPARAPNVATTPGNARAAISHGHEASASSLTQLSERTKTGRNGTQRDALHWRLPGSTLVARQMIRICFVCLGNICRSPTAEAVMRHLVEKAGLGGAIRVDSAGTAAYHAGEWQTAIAELRTYHRMSGRQTHISGTE